MSESTKTVQQLLETFEFQKVRLNEVVRLRGMTSAQEVKDFFKLEANRLKASLSKLSDELHLLVDFRVPFFTEAQAIQVKKNIEATYDLLRFEVSVTETHEIQITQPTYETEQTVRVFAETSHNPTTGELSVWSDLVYPEAGKMLIKTLSSLDLLPLNTHVEI